MSPPLRHIILIPSQPVFALSPYCVLSGEATNTNFIVFGLSRSGLEPTIYRTRREHANHYTIYVVEIMKILKYENIKAENVYNWKWPWMLIQFLDIRTQAVSTDYFNMLIFSSTITKFNKK